MSTSIVPILIAQQAAAQSRLIDRFRIAGATAPERAMTAAAMGIPTGEHGIFAGLRDKGIVRAVAEDTFWLDEVALIESRRRKPGRLLPLILALLAVLLGGLVALMALARD